MRLLLALFLLLVAVPSASAACTGGETVVRNGKDAITVTFHVRPREGFQNCQGNPDSVSFACDRRTGRVMRLGEDGISDGPIGFHAAGRFVAHRYWLYSRGGGDDHVDGSRSSSAAGRPTSTPRRPRRGRCRALAPRRRGTLRSADVRQIRA